ncbi:XAP5-domain-containing protein [Lophium mytilinum]|uniref:XAP5-domain-containing protein n=1 Tax=Lophium mytilinum TaxID=390894 RepID=A0A6A6QXX8_9PEZI|nr:XAP5-domain-containing protein [Lophium mytilinum]
MDPSTPSSASPSRTSTPNPATASRFTSQAATAEDLLKEQTVGLVHLSDFRKRRAEALDRKDRERADAALVANSNQGTPSASGASTPRDGASTPRPLKKKRKNPAKGKLSFGFEDDEDTGDSAVPTPRSATPNEQGASDGGEENGTVVKKKMGPNAGVKFVPKAMSKSALLREAQTREQLRKEFILMRDAVKATEMLLPFVFYDGTNIPGGVCRVKKGDPIWLFLDKARKVGAETGGGGGDKSRREWARVGVDDLMLVRGEIIIPHHYEFYYFMANATIGFDGPLFNYSAQPTAATPVSTESTPIDPATFDPLARPEKKKEKKSFIPDSELEGSTEDPTVTKVVDRRWYERNKHIFPASVWEDYDPGKDYSKGHRKDTEGNSFFFS